MLGVLFGRVIPDGKDELAGLVSFSVADGELPSSLSSSEEYWVGTRGFFKILLGLSIWFFRGTLTNEVELDCSTLVSIHKKAPNKV